MTQPTAERRDFRIRSVSFWDATPDESRSQRWSEVAAAVRPSQIVAMVEFGDADPPAVGIAGVTRYFQSGDRAIPAEVAQRVAERWCGADVRALQQRREALRNPYEPQLDGLAAIVELAALDALGHLVGLPAATLLGSRAHHRLRAYASLPSFATAADAVQCAADAVVAGFSAVKFHGSGHADIDRGIIRAVRSDIGPAVGLMWDGSCAYSLEDATAVGRELAQHDALWFEAPMPDESGPALRILASRVQVPLVPDGLVDRSPGDLVTDTRDGIWGAIRLDVTRSSSLGRSLQLVRLAEILGLPAEVQSYGFPLARHANLQLMLTSSACRFYESPFPDTLADPLADPPVLDSGYVHATDEPGLGHGTTADAVRGACALIAEATVRAPQATRLPQRAR